MTTEETIQHGIVVKKMLGKYTVRSAGGSPAGSRSIVCTLIGNLSKRLMFSIADPSSMPKRVLDVKEIDTVDPVAVGDVVSFELVADGSGVITAIQPRRNKLSRPVTDGARRTKQRGAREQVVVANIDQIV